MNTLDLFDTKEQLLSFRDTVGTVLGSELSTRLKGRRLDELSARLLGVADFNTALGLIAQEKTLEPPVAALKAALDLVWKSRDYLAEHGIYPQAMIDLMGPDAAIDDFLADVAQDALVKGKGPDLDFGIFELSELRFPPKISLGMAGTLPHRVSNNLEKHFHPSLGFARLHGYFHGGSWGIEPPQDCSGAYRQGWKIANNLAVDGRLDVGLNSDTPNDIRDDQAPGFWDRQKRQRELLQRDIDSVTEAEKLLNITVTRRGKEHGYRWVCEKARAESAELWATYEEALFDGMKSMGGFGFCNSHDFDRIYKSEGWFFDFFETEEEGLIIQLMGSEPEEPGIPALTDEQAWEWVVDKARKGSILHEKALNWIERVCPSERERIRAHTGF